MKKAGLLQAPVVQKIAHGKGVSPAAVLLRWNLQRGVAVIPKSANPMRVQQNVQQPWSFTLNTDEIAELDSLADGARFCTAPWSTFDDRTASDKLLTGVITGAASAIFSVASLDVTSR